MRELPGTGSVLNVSAIKQERWSDGQKEATEKIRNGYVLDCGSPTIPTDASTEDVVKIAFDKFEEITKKGA